MFRNILSQKSVAANLTLNFLSSAFVKAFFLSLGKSDLFPGSYLLSAAETPFFCRVRPGHGKPGKSLNLIVGP